MNSTYYLKQPEDFYEEKRKLSNLIDLKKQLPENMYPNQYDNFFFSEFNMWGSSSFWSVLRNLAKHYGDTHVLTAIIDPHPEDYFYAHFNHYNWANIPLRVSEDEYFDIITRDPLDSPADAIMYNSYKLIWTSESHNWLMYGDRDLNLIVTGVIGENEYLLSRENFYQKSDLSVFQGIVDKELLNNISFSFR
ncbi:hypothetical protein GZ22_15875 [Terribacillus saccharophilus]|uniref:Uncharacterized protein n=1 Tax=Terribacillus saccharophilus TaxID=361277 RepID=A0A075LNK5_9BACI|nr:hypothetical protein [Terribacillus goriensis]AIF67964.1 hypothetical protein GZ22_15875 [Terribacillus goriensis]